MSRPRWRRPPAGSGPWRGRTAWSTPWPSAATSLTARTWPSREVRPAPDGGRHHRGGGRLPLPAHHAGHAGDRAGHAAPLPPGPVAELRQPHEHDHVDAGRGRARIRSVGLCHSVQGTAERLAGFAGVPTRRWPTGWRGSTTRPGSCSCATTPTAGRTSTPACGRPWSSRRATTATGCASRCCATSGTSSPSPPAMSEYVPWFRRTAEDRERYTPVSTPDFRRPATTNGAGNGGARRGRRAWWRRAASAVPTRRQQVWESIKQQIAGEAPSTSSAAGSTARTSCTPWSRTPLPVQRQRAQHRPDHQPAPRLQRGGAYPDRRDRAAPLPRGRPALPAGAAINRTNVNVQELAVQGFLRRDRGGDPPGLRPRPTGGDDDQPLRHPFHGGRAVRGQRALAGRVGARAPAGAGVGAQRSTAPLAHDNSVGVWPVGARRPAREIVRRRQGAGLADPISGLIFACLA